MKTSFLTFGLSLFLLAVTCVPMPAAYAGEEVRFVPDTTHVDVLPVMALTYDEGAFSAMTFTPATFTLYEADSVSTYACRVRRRGATSLVYDKPNYAIKVVDDEGEDQDVRLCGMRKDNYWVLDGMASDYGKVRNRVSMDLWLDYSRPPYHQEAEPKAVNGYRGRYVEVWVNDRYEGLFCLMERVDRKQLKLKKYKKAHEAPDADSVPQLVPAHHRGLLYKAVNGTQTRTPYLLYQSNEPDNTRHSYDGMQGEYPDVAAGEPWTWEPLRNNIYYLAAKTSTTFNKHIGEYYDVPVFIDYVLLVDLLVATDNVGKNVMYWMYDQSSADQRLGITPWDLDTTWGRNYMGSPVSASKELSSKSNFDTRFRKWYKDYDQILANRYAELRDSLWQAEALMARFDAYFDLFALTGAWDRELARWGASNCKTRDLGQERDYLRQWISGRLAFLDETYGYASQPEEPEPEGIDTLTPEAEGPAACYDLMGRRLQEPGTGRVVIMGHRPAALTQ